MINFFDSFSFNAVDLVSLAMWTITSLVCVILLVILKSNDLKAKLCFLGLSMFFAALSLRALCEVVDFQMQVGINGYTAYAEYAVTNILFFGGLLISVPIIVLLIAKAVKDDKAIEETKKKSN